jgi:hypothetical protein
MAKLKFAVALLGGLLLCGAFASFATARAMAMVITTAPPFRFWESRASLTSGSRYWLSDFTSAPPHRLGTSRRAQRETGPSRACDRSRFPTAVAIPACWRSALGGAPSLHLWNEAASIAPSTPCLQRHAAPRISLKSAIHVRASQRWGGAAPGGGQKTRKFNSVSSIDWLCCVQGKSCPHYAYLKSIKFYFQEVNGLQRCYYFGNNPFETQMM